MRRAKFGTAYTGAVAARKLHVEIDPYGTTDSFKISRPSRFKNV
jgi:hypothetical protein